MKNIFLLITLIFSVFAAQALNTDPNNGSGDEGKTFFVFNGNFSEMVVADKGIDFKKLEGVTIEIVNNTQKKKEVLLNSKYAYQFSFKFQKGNYYTILFRKQGYFTKRIEAKVGIEGCVLCFKSIGDFVPGKINEVANTGKLGKVEADIVMRRMETKKPLQLDNIYFGYGKWEIDEFNKLELDKFGFFLKDNPEISVKVEIHTDTRGEEQENLELSEKRAASILAHLKEMGIEKKRLEVIGLGESKPLNDCGQNGCTEKEHQENRRIVFSVTKTRRITKGRGGRLLNKDFSFIEEGVGKKDDFYKFNVFASNLLKEPVEKTNVSSIATTPGRPVLDKTKVNKETKKEAKSEVEKIEKVAVAKSKRKKAKKKKAITKAVQPKVVAEKSEAPEMVKKEVPADLAAQPIAMKGGAPKKIEKAEAIKKEEKIEMAIAENTIAATKKEEKLGKDAFLIPVDETKMSTEYSKKMDKPDLIEENNLPAFDLAEPIDEAILPAPLYTNTRGKLLPKDYTGYTLEIVFSEEELGKNHAIFEEMRNVYHEKVEGGYSYMIGPFTTKEGTEDFYRKVMYVKFPDARVIRYKKGKRR